MYGHGRRLTADERKDIEFLRSMRALARKGIKTMPVKRPKENVPKGLYMSRVRNPHEQARKPITRSEAKQKHDLYTALLQSTHKYEADEVHKLDQQAAKFAACIAWMDAHGVDLMTSAQVSAVSDAIPKQPSQSFGDREHIAQGESSSSMHQPAMDTSQDHLLARKQELDQSPRRAEVVPKEEEEVDVSEAKAAHSDEGVKDAVAPALAVTPPPTTTTKTEQVTEVMARGNGSQACTAHVPSGFRTPRHTVVSKMTDAQIEGMLVGQLGEITLGSKLSVIADEIRRHPGVEQQRHACRHFYQKEGDRMVKMGTFADAVRSQAREKHRKELARLERLRERMLQQAMLMGKNKNDVVAPGMEPHAANEEQ